MDQNLRTEPSRTRSSSWAGTIISGAEELDRLGLASSSCASVKGRCSATGRTFYLLDLQNQQNQLGSLAPICSEMFCLSLRSGSSRAAEPGRNRRLHWGTLLLVRLRCRNRTRRLHGAVLGETDRVRTGWRRCQASCPGFICSRPARETNASSARASHIKGAPTASRMHQNAEPGRDLGRWFRSSSLRRHSSSRPSGLELRMHCGKTRPRGARAQVMLWSGDARSARIKENRFPAATQTRTGPLTEPNRNRSFPSVNTDGCSWNLRFLLCLSAKTNNNNNNNLLNRPQKAQINTWIKSQFILLLL